MDDANKAEYDALVVKLTAHKENLTAATTAANAIVVTAERYTNASEKSGVVSALRNEIAGLDKVVKLTPGGASKKHHQKSKKQQKKKGGKSRRHHK